MRLGALVVGQSPRTDVELEIRSIAGPTTELVLRGALDDLSRETINSLVPIDKKDTLFTRLPDGAGVIISKQQVLLHGAKKLDILQAEGLDLVILLCTGTFPQWATRKGLLFPSRTLAAMVKGFLPSGRLGVFSPLPEQCAETEVRWRSNGYEAISVALSPNASEEQAAAAAAEMASYKPELIVLDCISYTRKIKTTVRTVARLPVIMGLSSSIRSAVELID